MKRIIALTMLVLLTAACVKPNYPTSVAFSLPMHGASTEWNSKDYRGKPVFIAVMATYCGYCKMSVPMVNDVYNEFKSGGLEVVGIFANPTDDADLAKYIADNNVTYPVLYDGGDLFDEMGVQGVPHFVLLDKNHMPVKTWGGYSQNHNFEADIAKALK